MIAKVSCAALMGIDAFKVELEVDFSRSGMPAFIMVGLAEGAVREAKERVFFRAQELRVQGAASAHHRQSRAC